MSTDVELLPFSRSQRPWAPGAQIWRHKREANRTLNSLRFCGFTVLNVLVKFSVYVMFSALNSGSQPIGKNMREMNQGSVGSPSTEAEPAPLLPT